MQKLLLIVPLVNIVGALAPESLDLGLGFHIVLFRASDCDGKVSAASHDDPHVTLALLLVLHECR